MRTYGLIGYPLAHSFSQRYFTDKFLKENKRERYLNFELEDIGRLPEIVLSHKELAGLNVTIPYKERIIPLLSGVDAEAARIGAVNTIRITRIAHRRIPGEPRQDRQGECSGGSALPAKNSPVPVEHSALSQEDFLRFHENPGRFLEEYGISLEGFNTDVFGFSASIAGLLKPHHRRALILGSGGASKAVKYALSGAGIDVLVVSRTPGAPGTIGYDGLTRDLTNEFTVVVNATPLGTFPREETCPPFPYQWISPCHLLYDLVYNPEETRFLALGRKQGATVKNGYEMLVLQAEKAYEIWNETTPH